MTLFSQSDLHFARAISRLAYCNPFLPERIACERQALGDRFPETEADWKARIGESGQRATIERMMHLAEPLLERLREQLTAHQPATANEQTLYEDLCLFVLYHRYLEHFRSTVADAMQNAAPQPIRFYRRFADDARRYFEPMPQGSDLTHDLPHLFACLFQVRRAFLHIANYIVGSSPAAIRLRAAVWQSIFTYDMRRYRRGLFLRMADHTTLVTGPSGTGKELVARAIGLSRYIPFDGTQFKENFAGTFHAVNLSALSPTLIESELFGHVRGAFTGAVTDRAGWLEACPPLGTVFLDELGELDPALQVKLLRVLQTRTFQRLGETAQRHFAGKIIAATNRDLAREMEAGRFRADFYYRLCSDLIVTPSLAEQLADSPAELEHLVRFIAGQVVGPDEAAGLSDQVLQWIDGHLGRDYPWPGNFRELEQCVRNVLIRGTYHPAGSMQPGQALEARFTDRLQRGELTADELLRYYCTLIYQQVGSYEAAARRLGLDRRTVRNRVDPGLLGGDGSDI